MALVVRAHVRMKRPFPALRISVMATIYGNSERELRADAYGLPEKRERQRCANYPGGLYAGLSRHRLGCQRADRQFGMDGLDP
jgi:hypothetical protein